MTQLVLHIGGEKTGTTALQDYLHANSELLNSQSGVLYPNEPPLCFNNAHFPVANAFLRHKPLEFMRRQKALTMAELQVAVAAALAAARPRVLLLSAEHFSSRLRRGDIQRLTRWLRKPGLFESIRIVFYARPQASLAVLALSTMLRAGWRGWIGDVKFGHNNLYFNHFRTAELWAESFGDEAVSVRRYDAGVDIIADFLETAGINRPQGEIPPKRLNEGLSYQALRLLHLVNQHLAMASDDGALPRAAERDRRLRRHIMRFAAERLAPDNKLPAEIILTPALRNRIRRVFAEPNRRLKERFGVDLDQPAQPMADSRPVPADGDILAQALVEFARDMPTPGE